MIVRLEPPSRSVAAWKAFRAALAGSQPVIPLLLYLGDTEVVSKLPSPEVQGIYFARLNRKSVVES